MLATLCFLKCSMASAAALHSDDFQAVGASGWDGGAFGGQLTSRVASGGPAGASDAFLELQTTGSNLATRNLLPAWIGNYSAIGATRISADLRNAPGADPLAMRIVLFGPGATTIRWTSAAAATVPADGVWRNYTFSLAEADLALVLGTSSYTAMLADVAQVMLRHDPGDPSSGGEVVTAVLGIDNIRLRRPSLVGDYNDDDLVTSADYLAWQTSFGAATPNLADGNHDGAVDAADYTVWRDAAPSPSLVAAVPEPAAVTLAIAAAFGALAKGRRWTL